MKKQISILLLLSCIYSSIYAKKRQPQLENKDSWSMIVLPDPQTYVKFEQNQPILSLMTKWIKLNKDRLNIELVLCEGDLVEQNNIAAGDGKNGDQNSTQQWTAVREAFSVLDTLVPYILCTGNHDYGFKSAENRQSRLDDYFAPSSMPATQTILTGMLANSDGKETLENAYYEYLSPHGVSFLIFSLEFNPRDTIVQQAKEIVDLDQYKDHKVIILTHSYMYSKVSKNALIVKENYQLEDVTHGKELWKQLIAPSRNIEMLFCGHIASPQRNARNVGYRNDKNAAGNEVHQMLFNAQANGGGWYGNGGDGWLRIVEFLPDGRTVIIKTYSPFFAHSPKTSKKAWRNRKFDHFTILLSDNK